MNRKDDMPHVIFTIMNMPMVKKYRDGYSMAQMYEADLHIPLYNARKNYFNKTIKEIEKIEGVRRAYYDKAQDTTTCDFLRIYFKKEVIK